MLAGSGSTFALFCWVLFHLDLVIEGDGKALLLAEKLTLRRRLSFDSYCSQFFFFNALTIVCSSAMELE